MKLICLLFFIYTVLPCNECSWFELVNDIPGVSSVGKKTIEVKEYFVEKGRNLKNNFFSILKGHKRYEAEMNTIQMLAYNGYVGERHTVVTDDGYILEVHRIPYSKHSLINESPRRTVLLHHGILGSSADWVIGGPGKGLAYVLSDFGYDVWMANVRGNTYSKRHVSRSIDSYDFWNFSFHEVAQYDLPAVIDYITDIKGSDVKINYVGFSMGTTVLFTLLATKPQYNEVLNAGFAMAPIAYMSKIKSPIRLLAKYNREMGNFLKMIGENEFLPQNSIVTKLSNYAYNMETRRYKGVFLKNIFFILCGHDETQFNKELVPAIWSHMPAGTSTKTLLHFAQEIENNGKFQQFDYGVKQNFRYYGTEEPPEYSVEKITLPIALISAPTNDWLSSYEDVRKLYNRLPNPIEHYVVPYEDFNHVDFLWGINAPAMVYDKLLQLLEKYN